MTRVNPRLLLALGAVVLVAWVAAPQSSSPPPQVAVTTPAVASADPVSPEIEQINREVDRLRDRLTEPARATEPVRDPFQFIEPRVHRAASQPRTEPARIDVPVPAPSTVSWPSLVAILSSGNDRSPSHQVVLEDASELVQFRSAGEAMGDIVVTAITADQVTLTHSPSGESTQLTLR